MTDITYNKESGEFEYDLPTDYQKFIHLSRYARWMPEKSRRETWNETVNRYLDYWGDKLSKKDLEECRAAMGTLNVMPSMRAVMTAGIALDRDNVAGYNCAFIAIDHVRAFDEILYILMCGTGVGFSVERQAVSKLPIVSEDFHKTDSVIHVADSKIGWAKAFKELLTLLWVGEIPTWDLSKLREAGAPLKTFGGRSSGPEPLDQLFHFAVGVLSGARGRRLSSIEVHDLVCKIAEVVVVGGVRRSALISLSNVSDDRMRHAKTGQWWIDNSQRSLANNSACYTEKPDFEVFLNEWKALYESKSGERGIVSRVALDNIVKKIGRRETGHEWGTNPCSEIILRSCQFCNLSEVVVRHGDSLETLKEKVRIATIFGTLQSTLTDFRYLRKIWRANTEEECLLGVSLTGVMDHDVLSGKSKAAKDKMKEWLPEMKQVAIDTNKEWAEKLGINQSTAITCLKPSGTVSQLVDAASGIHPRHNESYIRRVRIDEKDPIGKFMEEAGFEFEVDVMSKSNKVFSFPIKAPKGCITRTSLGALEHLDIWKIYQEYWCEHKPSITVNYKDEEFLAAGDWVWNNFDLVSGISFLPHTEHTYQQAPYEDCDLKHIKEMEKQIPKNVDWSLLGDYEKEDNTTGSQTMACSAGVCEVVDLTGT